MEQYNLRDKLTIGILSYNVAGKLRQCLASIQKHLPYCRVIVWDNSSEDDSVNVVRQEFPEVQLVNSSENLWFAEGCNQLVRQCRTKYVMLLNADVFIEDSKIYGLIGFIEKHRDVVAVSPSIMDNQQIRHAAHKPITPLLSIARDSFVGKMLKYSRWYKNAMFNNYAAHNVFFAPKITNCCCVLNRRLFLNLGGFDSDQLLYWTEEEFALRARRSGYRMAVYGPYQVVHEHGSSTSTLAKGLLRAIYVRDRIGYMRKNFGLFRSVLVETAILLRPKIWNSIYDYVCFLRYKSQIERFSYKIKQLKANLI